MPEGATERGERTVDKPDPIERKMGKRVVDMVGSELAAYVKALPIRLTAPRPLEEAISSAGGVRLEALDAHLMLRDLPDVHCAGEMLDWEAPTGGYLLSACLASGKVAAQGVLHRLAERRTGQGSAPA